jgi:hypothetical protein
VHTEVELEAFLVGEHEIALDGEVFGVVGVDDGELAPLEDCQSAVNVSKQNPRKGQDGLPESCTSTLSSSKCESSAMWMGLTPPSRRKLVQLCSRFLSNTRYRMS